MTGGLAMTDREWLAAFADVLGIAAPTDAEIDALLALAAEAAHSSQRTAAPVACWLAARAGRTPDEACDLAAGLGERPAA
jgi:hypothetical protein